MHMTIMKRNQKKTELNWYLCSQFFFFFYSSYIKIFKLNLLEFLISLFSVILGLFSFIFSSTGRRQEEHMS